MSEYRPFRLSHTISAHSGDVRSVAFVNGAIVTTSRDGTAKLSQASGGKELTLMDSGQFLNSVATSDENNAVFIGAHDGSITRIDLDTNQELIYLGHTANVSCLDFAGSRLASGSWDHTVRVWESPESAIVLEGHTQNVWDVKLWSDTQLLSASADRTIKLWDIASKSALRTFVGHGDAVRSLAVLSPTHFASTSNDGTIIVWNFASGKPEAQLRGHQSFVYSLARLSDNLIVSSSEDRSVRVWDWKLGKSLQTIVLPSISQWSVAADKANGDFVVGSSDNTARVFSQTAERWASADELAQFDESVKASAFGENEIDDSQIVDKSVLSHPGKEEGQVVMVRGAGSQIEAHQFSAGVWIKIGDVVGSGQSSGSKKETHNGKQYDYVFDVDIEDGKPPLSLPFNNSDNPYIVAEKFVADNNLPSSYTQQIVQFIIQNSQAKSFDAAAPAGASTTNTTSASSTSSSAATPNTASTGSIPAVLQYSQLLFLKAFQKDPLLKALEKSADERGDTIQQYQIEMLLSSLPSSASELLKVALELKNRWSDNLDQLLPVFDLLRIAVADAAALPQQAVWAQLLSGIDPGVPKHALLATRGVVNLIGRNDFDVASSGSKVLLQQSLAMVQDVALTAPTISKPLAVALATLALNTAVQNPVGLNVAGFLRAIGPKVIGSGDAEAFYRFTLAIGLRTVSAPGETSGYRKEWFAEAPAEPRVTELLRAVIPRLPN